MYQDDRILDLCALGQEIKRRRKEKGWTQEYLAQLVDRTSRTIMSIENKGQYPSISVFFKVVTLLGISVDQFFYPCILNADNGRRQHIDQMLNSMTEKELIIMEATAEGLQKAREIEIS